MKKFNIKVAGRSATVLVDNPRFLIGDQNDYPKISVYHSWNQMSSKKAMQILTNSINIKALKRTLIARRIQLNLSMDKINAISKNNVLIYINGIEFI